jgi:hypothetical protein
MADFSTKYGTVTDLTVTLAGLGDTNSRATAEVDNSSTKAIDYVIYVKILGTSSSTDSVNVYVGGQLGDDNRIAGLTGSDAAFSGAVAELAFLDAIKMNGTTSVVTKLRAGVAAAYGGVCPAKFQLVFENQSGAALGTGGANFDVNYQAIHYSAV